MAQFTLLIFLILSNIFANSEANDSLLTDDGTKSETLLGEEKRENQELPTDVPLADRRARILTGANRGRRSQIIELRTSLGLAVGTYEQSERLSLEGVPRGRNFYAFRGIPYAKPPIGSLRWADPQEIPGPWERSRLDATRYQNFCPQYDHDKKTVVGNEDCLYMNIFTPSLPGENQRSLHLPVFVFIHGGAYTRGASSSHGPERLMTEDIVVVTFNYRLGVLGLLSTDDSSLPGNYAALDQVAALRWVRSNIAEFGGDPEAVTLGGFSAGASYVHLHLLSPLSQGLFQKAIMMSGAGNCLWSVQEYPWYVARQLAHDLDCPTYSTARLKECLLLKDTNTLIETQARRSRYVYWPFEYRPVVDRYTRSNPFLPDSVKELQLTAASSSPVPVLLGGTPEEGILFALTVLLFSEDSTNPKGVFDSSITYLFESLWPNITTARHMADNLVSFYFSDNAKKHLNTLVAELTDAMTDLLFTSCIWDAAANLASFQAPVYTYLMTHHDENSPSFAAPLYRLAAASGVSSPLLIHGVSHGDDVILLFNFPYSLGEMSPRDMQMSMFLTSFWGSFIRTGTPQSNTAATSRQPPWIPVQPGEPVHYYRLSLSPRMIEKPYRHKERNMWQQTLPLMERTYGSAYAGFGWQVASSVFLAVFLVLLIIAIIIGMIVCRRRRSKSYPSDGATLRSQIPRPVSLTQS